MDPAEIRKAERIRVLSELLALIDHHTSEARKMTLITKDFALTRTIQGTLKAFVVVGTEIHKLIDAETVDLEAA